jgi:hypothetical protein
MAIQILDDGSARMHSCGYSKGERLNFKYWHGISAPKDADKAIVLNITRIAQKVLNQIG